MRQIANYENRIETFELFFEDYGEVDISERDFAKRVEKFENAIFKGINKIRDLDAEEGSKLQDAQVAIEKVAPQV